MIPAERQDFINDVRQPCLFNKLSPQFLIYICENAVGFIPTAFLPLATRGYFQPLAAVGDSPLDRLLLEEVSHQRRVGLYNTIIPRVSVPPKHLRQQIYHLPKANITRHSRISHCQRQYITLRKHNTYHSLSALNSLL